MIVIPQHEARDILTMLVDASSQRAVAADLGVHHNTVYRWLHSDEIPRIAALAVMMLSTEVHGDKR